MCDVVVVVVVVVPLEFSFLLLLGDWGGGRGGKNSDVKTVVD